MPSRSLGHSLRGAEARCAGDRNVRIAAGRMQPTLATGRALEAPFSGKVRPMTITRRHILQAGAAGVSLAAMGRFQVSEADGAADTGAYGDAWPALDQFVEQYMRDMNSPGMTLVLADRDGVHRVVHLRIRRPRGAAAGRGRTRSSRSARSRSRSWRSRCSSCGTRASSTSTGPSSSTCRGCASSRDFAPITTHHLLTHTTGLPGAGDVFVSDPELRHLAAYAPGEHFHYNNAMYDILGILAWTARRSRAAGTPARADPAAARDGPQRACHHARHPRAPRQELRAVPRRPPVRRATDGCAKRPRSSRPGARVAWRRRRATWARTCG